MRQRVSSCRRGPSDAFALALAFAFALALPSLADAQAC